MRKASHGLVLVVLLAFAVSLTPAAPAPQKITVGEFAIKLAQALGYAPANAQAAAEYLGQAGVHLDANLRAPLTQGKVVGMLRDLGVDASAGADPDAPMTRARADMAAARAALVLGAAPDDFTPESLPATCTTVGDRMACNHCCLDILLPMSQKPIRAIVLCGILCARLFPPPSPSSPQ